FQSRHPPVREDFASFFEATPALAGILCRIAEPLYFAVGQHSWSGISYRQFLRSRWRPQSRIPQRPVQHDNAVPDLPHIAPKVKTSEVRLRSPDPRLRSADVLDNHWDMPASRFACFPLDAEAGVKQFVQLSDALGRFPVPCGKSLRTLPRHGHVAVL